MSSSKPARLRELRHLSPLDSMLLQEAWLGDCSYPIEIIFSRVLEMKNINLVLRRLKKKQAQNLDVSLEIQEVYNRLSSLEKSFDLLSGRAILLKFVDKELRDLFTEFLEGAL